MQQSQQTYFELGVIVHENGDNSNVWHKPGDKYTDHQYILFNHNTVCQFVTDQISTQTKGIKCLFPVKVVIKGVFPHQNCESEDRGM